MVCDKPRISHTLNLAKSKIEGYDYVIQDIFEESEVNITKDLLPIIRLMNGSHTLKEISEITGWDRNEIEKIVEVLYQMGLGFRKCRFRKIKDENIICFRLLIPRNKELITTIVCRMLKWSLPVFCLGMISLFFTNNVNTGYLLPLPLFLILAILCILGHEYAHACVAYSVGAKRVYEIGMAFYYKMLPQLYFYTLIDDRRLSLKAKINYLLAGIRFHLLLCGIIAIIDSMFPSIYYSNLLVWFFNIFLIIVNLLFPGSDGQQVLSIIYKKYRERSRK